MPPKKKGNTVNASLSSIPSDHASVIPPTLPSVPSSSFSSSSASSASSSATTTTTAPIPLPITLSVPPLPPSVTPTAPSPSDPSPSSSSSSHPILRIIERNPKQYEANLPDAVFQHILLMLLPEQIARCMIVCQRWKMVCGDEKLWKRICKETIQRYHPDPTRERIIQKTLQKELSQAADWSRSQASNKNKTGKLVLSGTNHASNNRTVDNHSVNSSSSSTTATFASNVVHQGLGSGMYIANDDDNDEDTDEDDDNLDPEIQEHLRRSQSNTSTTSTSSSISFYRTTTASSTRSDSLSNSHPSFATDFSSSAVSATDDDVSLSLAKQAYLNAKKERRMMIKAEIERITVIRNEMVDTFKKYVLFTKSFRTAYRTIPSIRHNGIYSLQHSYVRKGVRDMFHAVAGILKVTYYRTFWFREDGSLLYAMIPGQPFESVREFRRIANNLANTSSNMNNNIIHNGVGEIGTNSNINGNTGSTIVDPGTNGWSTKSSSVTSLSRDRILALNTKDFNSTIGKGWYTIEGRILKAEVITANNILTRWRMEIGSSYNGYNDRLQVLSFTLLEPGADPGAETVITQLNEETFEFRATPVIV